MSGLRKKNFSRPKIHTFPRRTKRPDAQKRTKYFTSGNNISEEGLKTLNSIISKAYQVPEELVSLKQMKDYLRDEKRKTRSDVDHHTYNSRLNLTWKLERLYVADDVELPGKLERPSIVIKA